LQASTKSQLKTVSQRAYNGASQIIPPDFPWEEVGWRGIPLTDYIFYELHVGAFPHEGTFDAIIPYLNALKDLAITALELMPIAQFPGMCNWGYDGVYPYAPQVSYGDSDGLRRLVVACHQRGLAVVLDVLYNRFDPKSNDVKEYGEYFTDAYKSAWGCAQFRVEISVMLQPKSFALFTSHANTQRSRLQSNR
jgi:maltooligosyltrehalose trehalohydrolase